MGSRRVAVMERASGTESFVGMEIFARGCGCGGGTFLSSDGQDCPGLAIGLSLGA